jgi:hypothetical protein
LRKIFPDKQVMSWTKRDWLFCLILAAVTILAYQPAAPGLLWDDDNCTPPGCVPWMVKANLVPAKGNAQYYPLLFSPTGSAKVMGRFDHRLSLVNLLASAVLCWC